ncbi:MAG: methionine synthase [Massiliimalia sp.]|jgi:hypothetical protein
MQITINTLNREEILRYLGYQGTQIPTHLNALIDRCITETLETISPKYLYRRIALETNDQGIGIKDTSITLVSKDLQEHLKNCREAYLFCGTLGNEMDRLIRRKMLSDPDEGVILDSCASTAIEAVADAVEKQLSQDVSKEGFHLTWRFSPGYGDWSISFQKDFLEFLDAHRKIGLTTNSSMLLTPGKSVTAILGISDTAKDPRPNKCDFCNNRSHCPFRKRGTQC